MNYALIKIYWKTGLLSLVMGALNQNLDKVVPKHLAFSIYNEALIQLYSAINQRYKREYQIKRLS